jgi:hypothetical protein
LLAQRTLDILRDYWKEYRPQGWLFPGKPTTVLMITHMEPKRDRVNGATP